MEREFDHTKIIVRTKRARGRNLDRASLRHTWTSTAQLHVVERWKLVDDKTLEMQVTVDDPDTFYQPWQATHRYRRIARVMGLSRKACLEINRGWSPGCMLGRSC
jgi:hypothetical protein